jgi:hypothetical protein
MMSHVRSDFRRMEHSSCSLSTIRRTRHHLAMDLICGTRLPPEQTSCEGRLSVSAWGGS